MTREEWLVAAKDRMRPWFAALGFPLPKRIRVSCGFTSSPRRSLGQCWAEWVSRDKSFEIFITPVLDDPVEVLSVFVHELCHTAAGIAAGRRGPFRRAALAIGLEGPMRSTKPSRELKERLNALAEQLGPYPHAELRAFTRKPRTPGGEPPTTGPKPQAGSRLKKLSCPACGYLVRTTQKWIAVGLPTCPCGTPMVVVDPSVLNPKRSDDQDCSAKGA